MELSQLQVGMRCTYYPPEKHVGDNLHYRCVVESVGKRVKVKLFVAGYPEGRLRSVSEKRLVVQGELLNEEGK